MVYRPTVYVVVGLSIIGLVLSIASMMHGFLHINNAIIGLGPVGSGTLTYELTTIALYDIAVFGASVFVVKDSFLEVATTIYVHEEILARMRRVLSLIAVSFSSASLLFIVIAIASVI